MAKDNLVPATNNKRSAFTLNRIEVASASIVAFVTWFGLHSFLHALLPFPCGNAVNNVPVDCGWTQEQAWQDLGFPIFSRFIFPLVLFNALAAIFLIRAIRRDVRGFSVLGSLALAWPLILTLGVHFLFYLGFGILPIGFLLSTVATITSVDGKRDRLDWTSLPVSFISMVIYGWYLSELITLYGD